MNLQQEFEQLREADRRTAPCFHATIERPHRPRLQLGFALAILATVAAFFLTRTPHAVPQATTISSWSSPTAFLLQTSQMDVK